jgi:hypothetical protein
VHGDDMVIATHGRGFWVLDDLGSLRQIATESSHGSTRLFAPSTAIRVRPAGFTGTPLPKEEPTAVNPPFGARIDYRLANAPAQPVRLAILDADGRLVRAYGSTDPLPAFDPTKAGTAPEWFVPPSHLSTTPGLHRFVWPLRYPSLPALADGSPYADGPWAPPGRYTIELTVDGQTYRQPLTVAPDPRVSLAPGEYARQFAFARTVESAQARLASPQAQAKQLHAAVIAARAAPHADTVDAALDAFDTDVVRISGLVDVRNPGNAGLLPPKSTHTFAFLSQALGKLAHAADDADAAPSADARAGYTTLTALLDATLADWQQLLATGLPALNQQLRGAGVAELSLAAPAPAAKP